MPMPTPRRSAAAAAAAVLFASPLLTACGDDEDPQITDEENTGEPADEPTGDGGGGDREAAGIQAIPSYDDADVDALGEQIGESWSTGMAGASAMTTAVLDGSPVVLSGTREGEVEIYDLDTGEEASTAVALHENAISALHVAEVDDRTLVISVEVGLAHVWDLDTGESVGEIDLGSDYDLTTVTSFRGQPAFVNAGKTITVTDLAKIEPLEQYEYDLGLSAGQGDVIELDDRAVLVAANSIGADNGVGAWDLTDGEPFHDFPMYEHSDRGVSEFAVGYLDEAVLTVSGDFDGNLTAWDAAANSEYGPELNVDGSSIRGLAVVEVGDTLVGVVGTLDRTMAFWDIASGDMLLETEAPGLGFEHLAVSELDGSPVLVTAGSGEISRFKLG